MSDDGYLVMTEADRQFIIEQIKEIVSKYDAVRAERGRLRAALEAILQAAQDGQVEDYSENGDLRSALRFIEIRARKALESDLHD